MRAKILATLIFATLTAGSSWAQPGNNPSATSGAESEMDIRMSCEKFAEDDHIPTTELSAYMTQCMQDLMSDPGQQGAPMVDDMATAKPVGTYTGKEPPAQAQPPTLQSAPRPNENRGGQSLPSSVPLSAGNPPGQANPSAAPLPIGNAPGVPGQTAPIAISNAPGVPGQTAPLAVGNAPGVPGQPVAVQPVGNAPGQLKQSAAPLPAGNAQGQVRQPAVPLPAGNAQGQVRQPAVPLP
ncbi:MAG: hypothetical protein HQL65_13485, partial [Magnetococcales bacterium]|nr:hypothetical protein [Magnetococcales bacterium]